MVPRFHMRRDKLCLFVMNLRKTKHLLLFAKIFPKMQNKHFRFNPNALRILKVTYYALFFLKRVSDFKKPTTKTCTFWRALSIIS